MNPNYTRYYTFIKPVIKNKIVKNYGTFIFSLLSVTVLLIFAVRPTLLTILSLQSELLKQQVVFKQAQQKSEDLKIARDNYKNLDPTAKTKLYGLIPPSTSIPCLVNFLSELAVNNQATISAIQFQPTNLEGTSKCIIPDSESSLSNSGNINTVGFTINYQGGYSQLVNILDSLKVLNRLVLIDTVSLSKQSQDQPLVLSISAKAIYIK